ncbi:MAG TPA: LLM class flavin-dependent oxidoreductase [Terriglobales bacterium]|jgi:alkanesulfonate monooxygenase SsuD/methylene tetrahydromethanopterin reductase-like flavin-dependent oxidoreductase (luciferase family)
MRFGIYCEMQTPPGKSYYDMTWEIMRQIEHADQSGFDVYSVIDHHFFQKFSISANPLAMFAAAAQRTERIRFRTALHTLPLENPMRLAGMIAEADILTNGRLEVGLGRGHAWLFGPSAMPLEESRPRYNEAVDILELAFTKDKFSYQGKFYSVNDVTVVPRPVQKPYPKFYTGGTSDITYQTAGQKGWGIFVPPLLPWKVLEGPLNIYKKACTESGHDPDIVYIRPVYIDEDERQIRKEVEQALLNFLAFNASPVESIQSPEKKAELNAKGYGFYASGALESLTKLTYEQIVEQEIGYIGTPEKVISQIRALQQKGGIGELAIVSNFGGLEHWKSIKTQHLFSKHVMPAFRGKSDAKAAD